MAIDILSAAHSEEEDYIDLEVSSYSIFHCNSFKSPPHQLPNSREFEFQMSSGSLEREQPSTSPADELFYKGKLLPLQLPPRLQMVEELLENSNQLDSRNTCKEFYSTPLTTCPSTPVAFYSTPFQSCNVSPSESCTVSRELNPNEYLLESLEDDISCGNPKKSWGRKIKLIKQSLLGPKLRTPQTYLKSLLGKYSCSNESCASNIHQASTVKAKKKESTCSNGKLAKVNQNQSSGSDVTRSFHKESEAEMDQHLCRRSLSGLSKRRSPKKISTSFSSCSSSSSSSDSPLTSNDINGCNELRFPKRSNSRNSEMESPIQGAIKHCKQSQHLGKSVAVFPESS